MFQRSYTIDILSYDHDFSSKVYTNITVKLVNHNGRRTINGSTIFRRNVEDFDVSLKLISVPRKNEKSYSLMDVTLNGCSAKNGAPQKSFNLVNVILQGIQSCGYNAFGRCPNLKVLWRSI